MRVDPTQWHEMVTAARAEGCSRFVTLTAVGGDGLQVWLRLRDPQGIDRVLTAEADQIASIVDLFPIAGRYEREAAQEFGITFVGNPNAVADPDAPMRKSHVLRARNDITWPGGKEPGESGDRPPSRRRMLPPGVQA